MGSQVGIGQGWGLSGAQGLSPGVAFLTKSLLAAFPCEIFENYLRCLNYPFGISLAFLVNVQAYMSCSHELKRGCVFLLGHQLCPAQCLEHEGCLNKSY